MPQNLSKHQKTSKAIVDLTQQRHKNALKERRLAEIFGTALQEVEAELAFNGKSWSFGQVVGQNDTQGFIDEEEEDLEAAVELAREQILDAEAMREEDWIENLDAKSKRKKEVQLLRAKCQKFVKKQKNHD